MSSDVFKRSLSLLNGILLSRFQFETMLGFSASEHLFCLVALPGYKHVAAVRLALAFGNKRFVAIQLLPNVPLKALSCAP